MYISNPTKEQVIEAIDQLEDLLKQLECKIENFQVDSYDKTLLREKMSILSMKMSSIRISDTIRISDRDEIFYKISNLITIDRTCSQIRSYICAKGPPNEEGEILDILTKIERCTFILRSYLRRLLGINLP
jgi:hypothetical protein